MTYAIGTKIRPCTPTPDERSKDVFNLARKHTQSGVGARGYGCEERELRILMLAPVL